MMSSREMKEYLNHHHISHMMESLVRALLHHRPEDPLSFLQSCLIRAQLMGGAQNLSWDFSPKLGPVRRPEPKRPLSEPQKPLKPPPPEPLKPLKPLSLEPLKLPTPPEPLKPPTLPSEPLKLLKPPSSEPVKPLKPLSLEQQKSPTSEPQTPTSQPLKLLKPPQSELHKPTIGLLKPPTPPSEPLKPPTPPSEPLTPVKPLSLEPHKPPTSELQKPPTSEPLKQLKPPQSELQTPKIGLLKPLTPPSEPLEPLKPPTPPSEPLKPPPSEQLKPLKPSPSEQLKPLKPPQSEPQKPTTGLMTPPEPLKPPTPPSEPLKPPSEQLKPLIPSPSEQLKPLKPPQSEPQKPTTGLMTPPEALKPPTPPLEPVKPPPEPLKTLKPTSEPLKPLHPPPEPQKPVPLKPLKPPPPELLKPPGSPERPAHGHPVSGPGPLLHSQLSIDSDSELTESFGLQQEVGIHRTRRPFIIFIIGSPGRGTVLRTEKLAETLGFQSISVDNDGETKDELVAVLRRQLIDQQDVLGFLLDGFPLDIHHALSFQEQIGSPDMVVLLYSNQSASTHSHMDMVSLRRYYRHLSLLTEVDAEQDEDSVSVVLSSLIQQKLFVNNLPLINNNNLL